MTHPALIASARIEGIDPASRSAELIAILSRVLAAIAADVLGQPGAPPPLPRGSGSISTLIEDPVDAAVRAAIARLESELALAVGTDAHSSRSRLDDELRRVELGLD